MRTVGNGTVVSVKAVPGASRDRIVGVLGDCLKITTSAPPEKGKANAAISKILAKSLSVPRSSVSLFAGAGNARKEFLIESLSIAQIRDALRLL